MQDTFVAAISSCGRGLEDFTLRREVLRETFASLHYILPIIDYITQHEQYRSKTLYHIIMICKTAPNRNNAGLGLFLQESFLRTAYLHQYVYTARRLRRFAANIISLVWSTVCDIRMFVASSNVVHPPNAPVALPTSIMVRKAVSTLEQATWPRIS